MNRKSFVLLQLLLHFKMQTTSAVVLDPEPYLVKEIIARYATFYIPYSEEEEEIDMEREQFPPYLKDFDASENYTDKHTDKNDTSVSTGIKSHPRKVRSAQFNYHGNYRPEAEDTDAKFGDPCSTTISLGEDYCERAAYPSKGRMMCAGPELKGESTCVCKFGQTKTKKKWVSLRYDKEKEICVSPNGGQCYTKFPTGSKDYRGNRIFRVNITKAHEQCDDPYPVDSPKRSLLCAQAHPRRFRTFNPYSHYCLQKEDRNLNEEDHEEEQKHNNSYTKNFVFTSRFGIILLFLVLQSL